MPRLREVAEPNSQKILTAGGKTVIYPRNRRGEIQRNVMNSRFSSQVLWFQQHKLSDIDFLRNQIRVRRSVYDGEVQTPKTKNAFRVIDVQPWLIQLIRQHIGSRKSGLVMMNNRNQAFRNTTVLRRRLHPLLAKLGIQQAGMHAFRHGRVSYLVEQGVSRDIIKAWIGHGSDAMIENYLHLRTSYRAAALANVSPCSRITRWSCQARRVIRLRKVCNSCRILFAGWSSLVARRAHNPKVVSSNLTPATNS